VKAFHRTSSNNLVDIVIIKNCKAFVNGKLSGCAIRVEDGKISGFGGISGSKPADGIIDAKGMLALPAFIDPHVHLRDPGATYKEDFLSGTCAALAGGHCAIIDMPNYDPPTITKRAMDEKASIAKRKAVCDYSFHFGASADNFSEIKAANPSSLKAFLSPTSSPLTLSLPELEMHFSTFGKQKPICVHAEDGGMLRQIAMKNTGISSHSGRRPLQAAISGVEKTIALAKKHGRRVHICHATSADEIKIAKAHPLATVEVAPHHLFLAADDISKKFGDASNVNPPLRSKKEIAGLWRVIKTIDMLATDHAPHTLAEKQNGSSGFVGLETAAGLMLNAVNERRLEIADAVRLMSSAPANAFGMKSKGKIAIGYDADIILVDMKEEWKVDADEFKSKCKFTPFEGVKLKGRVKKTIIRGELAYEDGEILVKGGFGKKIDRN
jgi:dihydroorotase